MIIIKVNNHFSARVAACLSFNSVCEHKIPKPLIRIN
jgi:hypothetical protein